jgi:hypothetical protein
LPAVPPTSPPRSSGLKCGSLVAIRDRYFVSEESGSAGIVERREVDEMWPRLGRLEGHLEYLSRRRLNAGLGLGVLAYRCSIRLHLTYVFLGLP